VVRDLDLLRQFRSVRVNLSIPTDSEAVWRAFEPKAPPLEKRWETAEAVRAAGVAVRRLRYADCLPLEDADAFVERLTAFGPDVLVTQDFHDSGGGLVPTPGRRARRLLAERRWTAEDYRRVVDMLRARRTVYEGEAGFFPPPHTFTSAAVGRSPPSPTTHRRTVMLGRSPPGTGNKTGRPGTYGAQGNRTDGGGCKVSRAREKT